MAAVQKKTQEINAYLKAEGERLKLKVPRNQIEKASGRIAKKLAALRAGFSSGRRACRPSIRWCTRSLMRPSPGP